MSRFRAHLERVGPPALVVLCALALYLPSIGFPLQWDDQVMIEREPALGDIGNLPRAIGSDYLALASTHIGPSLYYRPVSSAVLFLERAAFGTRPEGFRLVHTGLHLAAALLLYWALLALLREGTPEGRPLPRWPAALGAALFAALPYDVDAVLLLTDVGSPLALGAALAALGLFDRHRNTGRLTWLAGAAILEAVAILAKETAMVLPGVLLARYLFDRRPVLDRRAAAGIAVACGIVAAGLAARALVLGPDLGIGRGLAGALSSLPVALAAAARWTVAPYPLGLVEPLDLPGTPLAAAVGIAVAVLAAAGIAFSRRRLPALALGLAAWLLAALPVCLAVFRAQALSPRWLYMCGAALAVAATVSLTRLRGLAVPALAGLLLSAALLAAIRVSTWRDDLTLWGAESERHPDRAENLVHLGLAVERAGDSERALDLQLRAAALAKGRGNREMLAHAHLNAGRLLARSTAAGQLALRHFLHAARANPLDPAPWIGAGDIHARDGDWLKALEAFEQAVDRAPLAVPPLIGRAGALAALGRHEAALEDLDRAAGLATGSPTLLQGIAARRTLVEGMWRSAQPAPAERPTPPSGGDS